MLNSATSLEFFRNAKFSNQKFCDLPKLSRTTTSALNLLCISKFKKTTCNHMKIKSKALRSIGDRK